MVKKYSDETLLVLRNCNLIDRAVVDGVGFVRCIPRPASYNADGAVGWKLSSRDGLNMAGRVVREIGEKGVCVSYHPDFGDYVRVNDDTETFRLICQMKS